MGILLDFAFDRTSSEPVDSSLVLSKAEMLAVNDNMMPDTYFAVCKDDKKFYIYDKSATPSAETGKFTVYEGGGGGEEGKTYTMDWDEDTHELTLTDGTTPQKLELVGLAGQVDTMPTAAAGDEGKIVQYIGATDANYTNGYFYQCVEVTPATDPKTYTWKQKNVQDGGGSGTGDANFELDTTNNSATISNQNQGLGFDLSETNVVTMTASEPGTYQNSKILATKGYVDTEVTGKEDAGVVFDASTDYAYATLSNAASKGLVYIQFNGRKLLVTYVNDVEGERDISFYVENSSGTYTGQYEFRWIDGEHQTPQRRYVYPTGGTTGQVLTKKSNSNSDVEWTDAGGAKVQVNSTGEFGQTKEGDNLISFSDNGTNVDMQMAKGSTANNLTLATKDYVDGRTGINFAVGKETWYGTYTDENDVTYQVYTKTVYIPALPSTAGVTTYPHDVSGIRQILQIYGSCSNGFVMNAPRQTVTDNITIYQASKSETNKTFSIEVGKDRSNLSAYVTMVYAKNN